MIGGPPTTIELLDVQPRDQDHQAIPVFKLGQWGRSAQDRNMEGKKDVYRVLT